MTLTSVVAVKSDSPPITPQECLVHAKEISLRLGSFFLSQVSFAGHPKEIILVLGQNGAGKSSLLRVLAGLLEPQSGTIFRRHQGLALVSHEAMMYGGLTVQQNLSLFCALDGQVIPLESLKRWGLSSHLSTRTSLLSRGLTTRLSLLRALNSPAELLLFDEPTSNLDDSSTEIFNESITQRITDGRLAIIATHDVSRLLSVATRIIVIGRGTIVADSGRTGSMSDALNEYHRLNR